MIKFKPQAGRSSGRPVFDARLRNGWLELIVKYPSDPHKKVRRFGRRRFVGRERNRWTPVIGYGDSWGSQPPMWWIKASNEMATLWSGAD